MIVTDKPKTTTSVVVVVVFVFVVVLVAAAIVFQHRRWDGIVSMRKEIGNEKETNAKNIYLCKVQLDAQRTRQKLFPYRVEEL